MLTLNRRYEPLFLFLAVTLFFLIGLGARPYIAPSEARYIAIPMQMIATGDWLTPRINGVPYFEKPPLFYWLQAATMSIFGTGEFAGRLITSLLVSLTCLTTYATARTLYGRISGLLSALVLATCLMGYGMSRVAQLDAPVTLFITATIALFLIAHRTPDARQKRNRYYAMYIAAALAVMSKGLICIVIPGIVIGAWIALTGNWRILREARLIPGLILFLIIAAPWHILMSQRYSDFADFYFIHEHVTRYVSTEHKRTAPFWSFFAVTILGLLPWTFLLPAACKHALFYPWSLRKAEPERLFLILWIVLPLLFFSASSSKLIPYIFPIFPPLCVVLGHYLAVLIRQDIGKKALSTAVAAIAALYCTAIAALYLIPHVAPKLAHKIDMPEFSPLAMVAPVFMAAAFLFIAAVRERNSRELIGRLSLIAALLAISINFGGGYFDRATVKPLAEQLKPHLDKDDWVVAYKSFWQDLPVYLNRDIIVSGWTGELYHGVQNHPETQAWMITQDAFLNLCEAAPAKLFVFVRVADKEALPDSDTCRLHELGRYGKTLLLQKE
jgi:4-amino-4-deoxy-L-arabinose transferase-like glycosyltransferase